MDQDILSALSNVGLKEEEALIYKTVLSLGSRPASIIAQRAGLKRAHTYNVLSSLIEKGIVQEFIKNSVKHFACSRPASLLSIVEEREAQLRLQKAQLERMIPELERLQNASAARTHVRFFQGVEGIKQIFEDMLQFPGENIYGLTDVATSMTFARAAESQWIERFIRRRAELDIWWLGIVNLSPESEKALRTRLWLKRRVKTVRDLDLPVEINIYGPRVAITSTHTEILGFVVENENLARTLRSIHETVWELLPEYHADDDVAGATDFTVSAADAGSKRVVSGG